MCQISILILKVKRRVNINEIKVAVTLSETYWTFRADYFAECDL
jgi:hypothetical protein